MASVDAALAAFARATEAPPDDVGSPARARAAEVAPGLWIGDYASLRADAWTETAVPPVAVLVVAASGDERRKWAWGATAVAPTTTVVELADQAFDGDFDALCAAVDAVLATPAGGVAFVACRFGRSRAPAVAAAVQLARGAAATALAAVVAVRAVAPWSHPGVEMWRLLVRFAAAVGAPGDDALTDAVVRRAHSALLSPSLGALAPVPLDEAARASRVAAVLARRSMDWAHASPLCAGLWLGARGAARAAPWLVSTGVRLVVNAASHEECGVDTAHDAAAGVRRVELALAENLRVAFDPTPQLRRGAAAVAAALDAGEGVLVHCAVGMNRSVSVVLAFLMLHRGLTLLQALELVRRQRPLAYPHLEMFPALMRLEAEAATAAVDGDARGSPTVRPADLAAHAWSAVDGWVAPAPTAS